MARLPQNKPGGPSRQRGVKSHALLPALSLQAWSRHLRLPVPQAVPVCRPTAAAAGEVLAIGDQGLMQMAGELRNAVGPRVVAEEMAGHADLMAAAGAEHLLIEPRPVPDRREATGLQPGDVEWHHGDFCGWPHIAGVRGFCRLCPMLAAVTSTQPGGRSMLAGAGAAA